MDMAAADDLLACDDLIIVDHAPVSVVAHIHLLVFPTAKRVGADCRHPVASLRGRGRQLTAEHRQVVADLGEGVAYRGRHLDLAQVDLRCDGIAQPRPGDRQQTAGAWHESPRRGVDNEKFLFDPQRQTLRHALRLAGNCCPRSNPVVSRACSQWPPAEVAPL
jgi:hypothetical protein